MRIDKMIVGERQSASCRQIQQNLTSNEFFFFRLNHFLID